MDIKDAKLYEGNVYDLDDAIVALIEERNNGNNVYIDFNEHRLYSANCTFDSAYMELFGRSRSEFEDRQAQRAKNLKEIGAQREAAAKAKVPFYYEKGDALIDPSKKGQWRKCVDGRVADLYHGADLDNALEVMEVLHNGGSFEDAKKIIDADNHSGLSYSMLLKIVTVFSDRGTDLYRFLEAGKEGIQTNAEFLAEIDAVTKFEKKLGLSIASDLHEDWRKTRKKEDGTFEPRWKKIKDQAFVKAIDVKNLPANIRVIEGVLEIDIANSKFKELSPDWQKENHEAGKVVAGLVIRSKEETFSAQQIGEEVHNEWLKRNEWAKDDAVLSKPFAELPKDEQDKDLDQYRIAKKAIGKMKADPEQV